MELSESAEKELMSEFNSLGIKIDDGILAMCVSMCERNSLKADELVETWVAFSLSHLNGNMSPDLENLLLMETKELGPAAQLQASKPHFATPHTNPAPPPPPTTPKRKMESSQDVEMIEVTPNNKEIYENSVSYSFPPEIVQECGTPLSVLDVHTVRDLDVVVPTQDFGKETCMFSTLKDEANVIADATCHLIDAIKNRANLDEQDMDDSSRGSYYGGRIVLPQTESKLNPNCLHLHDPSSSDLQVDVSQLNHFSLFPGQVIVIKGIRSSGKIIASHLYDNASLPLPPFISLSGTLRIMVVGGPLIEGPADHFGSIEYLANCTKHLNVQVLILLGPILNSKLFLTPEKTDFPSLYHKAVRYLREQCQSTMKIYCVANKMDRCSLPVYPTFPPTRPDGDPSLDVVLLPDPAMLHISGLHLALTSTDILLHMAKHEVQKNCSEKFLRLSEHCLKQQSLYPLYPTDSPSTGMDIKLWYKHARITQTSPHILLLTSAFKYFIKESESGTVVINPGTLSSRKVTRTFAVLELPNPSSLDPAPWAPSRLHTLIYKA